MNENEVDDDEELALEMNWNICEQLPEEGKCREKLESYLTLYIEQLADGTSSTKALKTLSHHAFDIVMKMHQSCGRTESGENPAVEFVNALCKIIAVDANVNDELESLRRNMLRLVGLGEFSDKAMWKSKGNSYILTEVICQACNHCRDIDLMKDKHRALKDGIPVWLCAQCFVNYDSEELEARLIETINRKMVSYTLQDLQCTRCKEIKQDNIMEYCQCAGSYTTLIKPDEVGQLVRAFNTVADTYSMILLKEYTDTLLNNL
jgi:DNA polymerase epsilon subunit 1